MPTTINTVEPTEDDLAQMAMHMANQMELYFDIPLEEHKNRMLTLMLSYAKMYEQVYSQDVSPPSLPTAQIIYLPAPPTKQ